MNQLKIVLAFDHPLKEAELLENKDLSMFNSNTKNNKT